MWRRGRRGILGNFVVGCVGSLIRRVRGEGGLGGWVHRGGWGKLGEEIYGKGRKEAWIGW